MYVEKDKTEEMNENINLFLLFLVTISIIQVHQVGIDIFAKIYAKMIKIVITSVLFTKIHEKKN